MSHGSHARPYLRELGRKLTGYVPGFQDLSDPDWRRVVAYARLYTDRLAVLRDMPEADRFGEPGEYRATMTVAHLAAGSLAQDVAHTGRVSDMHDALAGYIAAMVTHARRLAAPLVRFGADCGDLVDADSLARITRAAHRGCCPLGADRSSPCHPGDGRVRIRVDDPGRRHRDLEPGCIVHAGAALAELQPTLTASARVLLIGPAPVCDTVRQYGRSVRAATLRQMRSAS